MLRKVNNGFEFLLVKKLKPQHTACNRLFCRGYHLRRIRRLHAVREKLPAEHQKLCTALHQLRSQRGILLQVVAENERVVRIQTACLLRCSDFHAPSKSSGGVRQNAKTVQLRIADRILVQQQDIRIAGKCLLLRFQPLRRCSRSRNRRQYEQQHCEEHCENTKSSIRHIASHCPLCA